MICHDFEQNSPEWYAARIGVLTASCFDKILTAKTGKISAQAGELENRIVAELLTGEPCEGFNGNGHTERGKELEPEAVKFYEFKNDCETKTVGFVTNDEKTLGCSPDRLVGDEGLLEIKCPAAHTHVSSYFSGNLADDHKPQLQGQLLITGRKWVDILSYHPTIPPSIIRVERDEDYIKKLSDALALVLTNIQTKLKSIKGE